ncbi:precorrin-6A reductase [Butyrivibrio sp. CB08]|uniref:precorrin-6A reductase n=1 Tax=Butyrivibrio sp. CB08 TaxID=2364879 RepID=UPI000EA99F3C|nr:precorrin-6A reductase [Butyrivibrio sp. CB08]RKM59755.1 precorrin-6A reductase [Butyrivibrio sp. CB08]
MADKILIFGGTTEGRELADALKKAGIPHVVSVATEYGREIEVNSGEDSLLVGRKSKEDIVAVLFSGEYSLVVDATHPFATAASKEIAGACDEASCEYLRLRRPVDDWSAGDGIVTVSSVSEAAKVLDKETGNILVLTGSRDLKELLSGISDRSRVYVRVLPSVESLEKCQEMELSGRQIIAMQGPFSQRMNEALIKEVDASVILTKESGTSGGFEEKLSAASACGIKCVVIANPEKESAGTGESCASVAEVLDRILENAGPKDAMAITLAGMGPGGRQYWTTEFAEAFDEADVIFGAKTVLAELEGEGGKKLSVPVVPMFGPDEICNHLAEHPEFKRPMVIYSGDISLCSGAKKGAEAFRAKGFEVRKISGISSVVLFANRLSLGLEDVLVVSAHGRKCNVAGFARENENLIVLPSDLEDAARIIGELDPEFRVTAGVNLGTDDEKVFEVSDVAELKSMQGKVLLNISNPGAAKHLINAGLRDDEITRGDVPMTKEEIRALSVRRLGLRKGAVLWDVGAGTGSISLEAALLDPSIEVYAIEKKSEAVDLLKANKDKFGLSNMTVIPGEAPQALKELPAPDSVFVGGSGKHLDEILETARSANPKVKIVVNCVTLETMTETISVLDKMGISDPDIIQVSVSRYQKRGAYHMADAQNPVFIISF